VRLGEAALNGEKSCPIMFWITDGAPSKPEEDKARICKPGNSASIEWFRERNILVLGGLLRPKDQPDADLFRPIVRRRKLWSESGDLDTRFSKSC